jgi:acetylornithine deacetylase/succinyl-diaminopimelate desuccinylase-like protein
MVDERTPAITVALRGFVRARVRVRTGEHDVHSGMFGGSALNAAHALHAMLAAVLPGADGRLRDELIAGSAPVAPTERSTWTGLPPGDGVLAASGARPLHARAGAELYERRGASASLDVTMLAAGEPRPIVPAFAEAVVEQRIAPGQSASVQAETVERLLRASAPDGADVDIEIASAAPAAVDADHPAIRLAAEALERAVAARPALVRSGGSIPAVSCLAGSGIPFVLTGFAVDADAPHAPDESFRLEALRQGSRAARELLFTLARLR